MKNQNKNSNVAKHMKTSTEINKKRTQKDSFILQINRGELGSINGGNLRWAKWQK